MRFLGVHVGLHDSNITYTDGNKVLYFKPERAYQIKHYAWASIEEAFNAAKTLGIDLDSLDAIGIIGSKDDELYHQVQIPNINKPTISIGHHYAHALSCWPLDGYYSGIKSFVLDGQGDNATTSIFCSNRLIHRLTLPEHESLGRMLRILGQKWGVKGHRADLAGKLMALQSYGKINTETLTKHAGVTYAELKDVFMDAPTAQDIDWLHTVHNIAEELIISLFKEYANPTEPITFAGGVAQNVVINAKLHEWNENILIPPHSPDDGLSLGIVEFLRLAYKQPPFSNEGFPFWQNDTVTETPDIATIKKAAKAIAEGEIIGWMQGSGELGPRALGNRSILMRPDVLNGKDVINQRVKHRENYRPFGCSVLLEDVQEHFDCAYSSPYMLYAVPVKNKNLPAITHIDGTCRIQTVSNGVFKTLLEEVKYLTGSSVVLNTSLNINGNPIAAGIKDAINIKGLDALYIGNKEVCI